MKRLLLLLTISVVCQLSYAQAAPELCQGAYFTEPQGKDFLGQHVPASKQEWETRAQQIRKRILEGSELQKMPPQKTLKMPLENRPENTIPI